MIWLTFHPVHVTLTSLDYIPEQNAFRGFVRLYMDDFLLDSGKEGFAVVQGMLEKKDPAAIREFERYLNAKLIISVNGKQVRGSISEMKIEGNEVDVDIAYEKGKYPETVIVKNLIMAGLYSDQSNMFIIKVADFEQGIKFTPDLTEQTFKIN